MRLWKFYKGDVYLSESGMLALQMRHLIKDEANGPVFNQAPAITSAFCTSSAEGQHFCLCAE